MLADSGYKICEDCGAEFEPKDQCQWACDDCMDYAKVLDADREDE